MHIYLPYADPPHANQSATDLTIAALAGPLTVSGYQLVPQPCVQPTDYEDGFRHWWHQGLPFLVWEHDIVPTYAMIAELAQCPEPWCAQAYALTIDCRKLAVVQRLWGAMVAAGLDQAPQFAMMRQGIEHLSTALVHLPGLLAYQVLAHRVQEATDWRWITYGEPWADWVGFGLTKFTPQAAPTPQWEPGDWHDLDSRVATWTHRLGIRWHIHYPLAAHYHVLRGDPT